MAAHGVMACPNAAEALAGVRLTLSLVTTDQALAAALAYAPHLTPGALWCDGNSVAPETKQAAAQAVEAAAGQYVDMAILAPVDPARLGVPVWPHWGSATSALSAQKLAGRRRLS